MKSSTIIIVIIILLLLALCCICILGVASVSFFSILRTETVTEQLQLPTDFFDPTPTVVITRPPLVTVPSNTLEQLENTIVPENDLADISCRLEGNCGIPYTLEAPVNPLEVGNQQEFWVTDTDTNENFRVNSTLRAISEHVYFWIEDGVYFDQGELTDLLNTFEHEIYPTAREFFGSEWTPGVDNDPHIYILYATGIGNSIAGYYSSADEYNPLVHEYSNGHEMFIFNADNSPLDDPFTYGVLAHEFQHMIHWYVDRNETSWLNEGFSELSAFLTGHDPGGFDYLFTSKPDLQVNDWPNDSSATRPHYGASFLFTTYFLDRFGETATKHLVANPLNGMASLDDTLASLDAVDPMTGNLITADDFFIDWVITNYLDDGSVGDGRYTYSNYPSAPTARETETIRTCPYDRIDRPVHQYGADYISIDCQGDYTLSFTGSTVTALIPQDPYSGNYAFWSNKGDEANMTLTHEFDFTGIDAPGNLSFMTWYDLEQDYDYLYLEASTDGEKWEILQTPLGTDDDPSGNSFGWAFNGSTNRWIQENVDLSKYAGQKVSIRFEYVTDAAVNGEGFLLDDVRVDSIGYFTDFENDDGGWIAEGFVRMDNILPQTYKLALILFGDATEVQYIELNPDQTVDIPLNLSGDVREAVLIVTGTTRYTRQIASYQVEIH